MCTSTGGLRELMTVVVLSSVPVSTPDEEMMPALSKWIFDACRSQHCREVHRVTPVSP